MKKDYRIANRTLAYCNEFHDEVSALFDDEKIIKKLESIYRRMMIKYMTDKVCERIEDLKEISAVVKKLRS